MSNFYQLNDYIHLLKENGLIKKANLTPELEKKQIKNINYNSQTTKTDTLFICKGKNFNPNYLAQAVEKGALAYIAEQEYMQTETVGEIIVSDVRKAMVLVIQHFFNYTNTDMTKVAITGTKGKTTTSYFMEAVMNSWLNTINKPACAILSTLETYDGINRFESHITTPEPLELYQHLDNAKQQGIQHAVMEVSSQALKYGRVRNMNFNVGCFLNIGADHISPIEHPNFTDYFQAKLKLFSQCDTSCININSDHIAEILEAGQKSGSKIITFGVERQADVSLTNIRKSETDNRTYFDVTSPLYNGTFAIQMEGAFNVENAGAVIAMSMALGIPQKHVIAGLKNTRVAGRMQVFKSVDKNVITVVDYAHNEMSFQALIDTMRNEYPDYKVISIFGSAGNKAKERRKDLARVANQGIDFAYLTEEDTDTESIADICKEIASYLKIPYEINYDRGDCIHKAVLEDTGKRIILFIGKGDEKTIKRNNVWVEYPSDVETTQSAMHQYDERVSNF